MSGNYCVASAGQYKAKIEQEAIFELDLSDPCPDAPEGEIIIGGETNALTFTMISPVVVSGLSDGRRRLSLESTPLELLAGRHGAASIVSSSVSWPCRVASYDITLDSCDAILAEPLPAELPSGETVYLSYRYVTASLPVVAEPVRDCLLTVDFVPYQAAKRGKSSVTYLVSYVHQIFSTGVTETDLRAYFYTLSSQPASDAGIATALQMGEDLLVTEIRSQLMSRGLTEDDIPAAATLRQSHLDYAVASMFRVSDTDKYHSMCDDAKKLCQAAIREIKIDTKGDGIPDATLNIASRASDTGFLCQRPYPRYRGVRWH